MFESIKDFKTRYNLTTKYILLNIRIILSSDKIQLLPKHQFVNFFVKNLNNKRKTTEFYFLYFTFSLKKFGQPFLATQIAHIVTC